MAGKYGFHAGRRYWNVRDGEGQFSRGAGISAIMKIADLKLPSIEGNYTATEKKNLRSRRRKLGQKMLDNGYSAEATKGILSRPPMDWPEAKDVKPQKTAAPSTPRRDSQLGAQYQYDAAQRELTAAQEDMASKVGPARDQAERRVRAAEKRVRNTRSELAKQVLEDGKMSAMDENLEAAGEELRNLEAPTEADIRDVLTRNGIDPDTDNNLEDAIEEVEENGAGRIYTPISDLASELGVDKSEVLELMEEMDMLEPSHGDDPDLSPDEVRVLKEEFDVDGLSDEDEDYGWELQQAENQLKELAKKGTVTPEEIRGVLATHGIVSSVKSDFDMDWGNKVVQDNGGTITQGVEDADSLASSGTVSSMNTSRDTRPTLDPASIQRGDSVMVEYNGSMRPALVLKTGSTKKTGPYADVRLQDGESMGSLRMTGRYLEGMTGRSAIDQVAADVFLDQASDQAFDTNAARAMSDWPKPDRDKVLAKLPIEMAADIQREIDRLMLGEGSAQHRKAQADATKVTKSPAPANWKPSESSNYKVSGKASEIKQGGEVIGYVQKGRVGSYEMDGRIRTGRWFSESSGWLLFDKNGSRIQTSFLTQPNQADAIEELKKKKGSS